MPTTMDVPRETVKPPPRVAGARLVRQSTARALSQPVDPAVLVAHLAAADPRQRRHPNLFTGFYNADNIRCLDLWPDADPASPTGIGARSTSSTSRYSFPGATSPGNKKAEPFAAAQPCGSHGLGPYAGIRRRSRHRSAPRWPFSGAAAAARTWGIMSRRWSTASWWCGNAAPRWATPARPVIRTYRKDGPVLAFGPFFSELFGDTTTTGPMSTCSDGGHSKIGLYEMIRRRCAVIVVSDAGQDGAGPTS